MFKGKHFYHNHIRNAIISFGMIFNNILVKRLKSDGSTEQIIKVPLSYSTKNKTLARIADVADLAPGRTAFENVVPRIGFEITSLVYDPSRKLNTMQTVRAIDKANNNGIRQSYVWTPYNMGVGMHILTKNQDDGLQIIEQILPFFNPDFNVPIHELPDLGVHRNIQFVLDGVNYSGDYEGSMDTRIKIIYDLNFTIKLNFFGYVDNSDLIKETIVNLYADPFLSNGAPSTALSGLRIDTTIDPANADPSGDYDYVQQFDEIVADIQPTTTTTTIAPTTTTTHS